MIETPFGKILVLADNQPVAYEAKPYSFAQLPIKDQPIAGCFRICIPVDQYSTICCMLEKNDADIKF